MNFQPGSLVKHPTRDVHGVVGTGTDTIRRVYWEDGDLSILIKGRIDGSGAPVELLYAKPAPEPAVYSLMEDADGDLWLRAPEGWLWLRDPEGAYDAPQTWEELTDPRSGWGNHMPFKPVGTLSTLMNPLGTEDPEGPENYPNTEEN